MKASIILSTYNAPAWLKKAIWGYESQSDLEFEVLIADDGSNERCCSEIERIIAASPLDIRHVWHEDQGFRKTLILNKALMACRSEYVIFSDGDCIPCPNFVATHKRFARKREYLSGGYVKLPMELSRSICEMDIRSGRAFKTSWLRKQGFFNLKASAKLSSGRFGRILNAVTTTRPTFNGHNCSAWLEHLRAANGFDNRMAYGGEDSELGLRLQHMGIRGRHIRHSTSCIHLDHTRGYVSDQGLALNRIIRSATLRFRSTRALDGLHEAAVSTHRESQTRQTLSH